MVTAPIMVALWDWLFREPAGGRAGRVRWTLVAGLGAAWLLLAYVVTRQFRAPSIDLAPMTNLALRPDPGRGHRALRAARVLSVAAGVPLRLAAHAPRRSGSVAGGVARRPGGSRPRASSNRHPLAFLGAWFFLILAPSSSVLRSSTEVAAEHRMYLPLAAVIARRAGRVPGWRAHHGRWTPAAGSRRRPVAALVRRARWASRRARGAACNGNAVGSSGETPSPSGPTIRARSWRTARRWEEPTARRGRGAAEAGDRAGSAGHVRQNPSGSVLARQGKYDEAIGELEAAVALQRTTSMRTGSSGEIHAIERRDGMALQHYAGARRVPTTRRIMAAHGRDPGRFEGYRRCATRRGRKALAERAAQLTGGRDPRILEILSGRAGGGRLVSRRGRHERGRRRPIARQMGTAAAACVARVTAPRRTSRRREHVTRV